jgi:uncharacterized protein (DUF302 family)
MSQINFKREINGSVEDVVLRLTEQLKAHGFGVLTRIDLHSKIKEKIGKDLPETVILGACNPQLAYEAVIQQPDVTSLLPCNAVVRSLGDNQVSVELAKPSELMRFLGDEKLVEFSKSADMKLKAAIDSL